MNRQLAHEIVSRKLRLERVRQAKLIQLFKEAQKYYDEAIRNQRPAKLGK